MANGFSDYQECAILDRLFPGPSSAPAVPTLLYLALFDSGGTELTGAAYERAEFANDGTVWADSVTDGGTGKTLKANAVAIEGTVAATDDWVAATHWKIFDDPTAGNVIAENDFTSAITVLSGQKIGVQAGLLKLRLYAPSEA